MGQRPKRMIMEALDRALLAAIELDVLHPAVLTNALEKALQQLRPQDEDSGVRWFAIKKYLAKVEGALGRLTHPVVEGGALATLLAEMKRYEDQRTRLATELAVLDGIAITPFDPGRVEEESEVTSRTGRAGPTASCPDPADPTEAAAKPDTSLARETRWGEGLSVRRRSRCG